MSSVRRECHYFKILIVPTIFFRVKVIYFDIQQNFKFTNNNFYKFIKKIYFISDKYK
jgi:hypothetical protein